MELNHQIKILGIRSEAERKLQERIEKGEALLREIPRKPSDQQAVQAFLDKKRLWSDYNAELLNSLFTTQQKHLEYVNSMQSGFIADFKEKILYLKSLRDQLPLIPEQISSSTHTTNTCVLTSLNSEIFTKCQDLYNQRAYSEAVEKSFKVVRDRLRQLTSYETGSEAFGKGKLHIRGAAAANVDKDFNEGVKFLTMAIDKFRNEKSHTSDAQIDDPVRAYEYLRLSSLAMNLLDSAEVHKDNN